MDTVDYCLIDYDGCFDCGRTQADHYCRKCGVPLCKQCYEVYHGLCIDCREEEINGDG
jgi:hypothetical protein